jgi:uncharacterized protein (DUF58 family)
VTRTHDRELLDPSFLRRLESLSLLARKFARGHQRGERASPHAGSGIAFASHRPYTAGDDSRFLDWKVFARSERLYVKQFEEERDLSVHILLDCSGSMAHADGEKFRRARELAAAIGYIALQNLDRVSLEPYAMEPHARLPPMRGKNRALLLLRHLSSLQAAGATDLRRAARAVCAHERRGGLAFVISDGFDRDGFLQGVDLLRYGRIEPVVLLVVDAREEQAHEVGELTLVDHESGRERTLLVTERLLDGMRSARRAHFTMLRRELRERDVRALELDVSLPLDRAVLELLRRAGVVA